MGLPDPVAVGGGVGGGGGGGDTSEEFIFVIFHYGCLCTVVSQIEPNQDEKYEAC
jgi:hypothetical protein